MDNKIDLTQAREYLTDLVVEAGEIIKKYFVSRDFTSWAKKGVDFTTQADEEIDAFLLENIKKQYPNTLFLTEETAPKDYSAFKSIDNLWIIDPLDGTVNFSRNNTHFAISIGLVDKGVTKLGVVYIPMTKDLYWAQADEIDAFLNEKPIKVSHTSDLKEMVLACDWGWDLETRLKMIKWMGKFVKQVRQIKCMGSAVSDLANLAEGKIDAYLHSGLKPWDVAASTLFIEKAGGKITTPTGEKWDVFNPEMLVSNRILHDEIIKLINY